MHLEAIKSKQQEIFKALKDFPDFYLVGGTALALQIGHRFSVDFDMFSQTPLSGRLISKVKRTFKAMKMAVIVNIPEQLSIIANDVKIDFVHDEFPLLLDLIKLQGVKMVKPPEIAAMKAFALNFRGTLKDYIDIYFLLKDKHTTLAAIKENAEKKYGNEFNFRLFIEQIFYLKDVKREKIEFIAQEPSEKKMQDFFKKEIAKIKL